MLICTHEKKAYILDWTMNDYAVLKKQLSHSGIVFEKEKDSEHIRAAVPWNDRDTFIDIVQQHLNAPYNYVDVQFPDTKTTVVIFKDRQCVIKDEAENEQVKQWAIEQSLPPEQADWSHSF